MSWTRRVGILSLIFLGSIALGCSSEIKIGAVISESGAVASYGDKVKKGLDLALDEINAAGGFKGSELQLIYRDDATNADRGRQVVRELIQEEGVRIIVGAISSPVTLGIAPICEKNRVVLLSPTASAPSVSTAGEYVYRNYPSDILEGTAMAKFAKELGLERVVIFALSNDWGAGLRDVFTQQYEGRFRQVVKTFDVEENSPDQIAAMLEELKELRPDGIYLVSYIADLVQMLGGLREAKIGAVLMGTSSVTEDVGKMGGKAAENLVYPQSWFDLDSQEPNVSSFVASYRSRYREDPDLFAAHGYDALKLLVLAMETGGSAHPQDVKIGLGGINNFQGAAGRTSFDENGDVVRYPRIFIIRDGKSVPYEQFVDEGGSLFSGS